VWFNGGDPNTGPPPMLRLAVILALASTGMALAADKQETLILTDPNQGRTLGRLNGENVVLQQTPTGTVGKIGADTVITHQDGHGNIIGKIGDKKIFCHTDAVTGIRICK
jgi:hypothetical protein